MDALVQGQCDSRFERVRTAFAQNFESGRDLGASAAVVVDGRLIVDLWGGYRDPGKTLRWQHDTIVPTASTTKTMTALCALLLADRGALDLDAPVARYWPEFACEGKSAITTAQCLGHTAGLPGWTESMRPHDLFDWEKATSLLARQAPWWEPGRASGYHASTQGYLVGEVIRRIVGETPGRFFAREVAGPLHADYHIGLPAEHDARLALTEMVPNPNDPPLALGSIAWRVANNPVIAGITDWTGFLRAEIPGGNGIGNARSVAQAQSILACGGSVSGKRFLSESGAARALVRQSDGVDLVFGSPVQFAMGYALSLGDLRFGKGRSCFWGGSGGSLIVVDFEARMTIAYVMNRLVGAPFGDPRNVALVEAVYSSLAESPSLLGAH